VRSSLARGYMPAQKHCELFYTLVGDVLGYVIKYAPIEGWETNVVF